MFENKEINLGNVPLGEAIEFSFKGYSPTRVKIKSKGECGCTTVPQFEANGDFVLRGTISGRKKKGSGTKVVNVLEPEKHRLIIRYNVI